MKQISLALLGLSFITLFLGTIKTTEGSLPSAFDTPGSLLADLWRDRFPDPFRVLEQIPLGLERDQSVALSPVRVDWKETPEEHLIRLDVPGMKKDEVKIEVEENRVVRVSGERKERRRKKEITGIEWRGLMASSGDSLGCLIMWIWTLSRPSLITEYSPLPSTSFPQTKLRVQGLLTSRSKKIKLANSVLLSHEKEL